MPPALRLLSLDGDLVPQFLQLIEVLLAVQLVPEDLGEEEVELVS